jgi:hypothetical protein
MVSITAKGRGASLTDASVVEIIKGLVVITGICTVQTTQTS